MESASADYGEYMSTLPTLDNLIRFPPAPDGAGVKRPHIPAQGSQSAAGIPHSSRTKKGTARIPPGRRNVEVFLVDDTGLEPVTPGM